MGIIDISVPIHGAMVVFDGDPPVSLERASAMADGAVANVSRLDFGVHTGTHVDAPVHFIDGAFGTDAFALDAMVGPASVVDATGVDRHLDPEALGRLSMPEGAERILLKTRNSELWGSDRFEQGFLGITGDGARWLVERGVRLVGIDYLSVAPYDDPTPTHRILLEAGIVILEGTDLRHVEPGPYELVCLPLRIVGADGAPARAVLIGP